MTNRDKQNMLDNRKWLESEKQGFDRSGKMPYCDNCKHQSILNQNCIASQEQRECQCLCAKAYNKKKKA